jgi:hypothetical protein
MRQALELHPDSRCAAVAAIDVDVARPRAGMLLLSYEVTGNIGDLRLPPLAAPVRTDELWRHTCLEAFICPAAGAAYFEFNFAPSTAWAGYQFDGYRSGMRAAKIAAPRIEVKTAPGCFILQAALNLSLPMDAETRLGLAAVIEEATGRVSYWALAHPPGKPDFHHVDCFACDIRRA